MELSKKKQDEAKKSNVTVQYLLMADLMSLGYTENDAYVIAYPENAALAVQQNSSIRKNIVESEKFKRLLEGKTNTPTHEQEADDGSELIDKTKTARLIMKAALKQPSDSKERIEGLMKYSDLMGYKKEEADIDPTENINFFLPMKCDQCPLLYAYNDWLKANGEKEVGAVEMGRIMSISHTIIEAAKDAE